jgi:ABC-type branched-subunit amino acid transport system ATPase component
MVGRNGSGKTLTLDMLSGFLTPSGGEVVRSERRMDGGNLGKLRMRYPADVSGIPIVSEALGAGNAMVGAHHVWKCGHRRRAFRISSAHAEEERMAARGRAMLDLFGKDRFRRAKTILQELSASATGGALRSRVVWRQSRFGC